MNDPAHAQVTIQQLCRINEELIGYMNPTEQQARALRENSIIIARLSLQIADFYKEVKNVNRPIKAQHHS